MPGPTRLLGTAFSRAVLRRVRQVPRGRVTTYGDVADAVGRPGAARAVGAVLRAGDGPASVPYHRVVAAGGLVHGEGARERARRLRHEGVRVRDGRVAGFARLRWPSA